MSERERKNMGSARLVKGFYCPRKRCAGRDDVVEENILALRVQYVDCDESSFEVRTSACTGK